MNDSSNIKKRIEWIDFAKALCIYLVVLGHALNYQETDETYLRNFIYIFHLPVFFFISGFLFHIKPNDNFPSYIWSNIKSLIVPYIFLSLLAFIIKTPYYLTHSLIPDLYNFLIGHGHGPAGPAWFLLCLFWIKIQMFFVVKCNLYRLLFLILIYGVLAFYFPWRLFWTIDASFMAMPIFIVGYITKKHFGKFVNNVYSPAKMGGIFLFSLIVTVVISIIQDKEAMFSRMFGTNGFLFYIGAFFGIIMIISFCKIFDNKCFRKKIILVFSSGSIIIMGLHLLFYKYTFELLRHFSLLPNHGLIIYKVIVCLVVMAEMYFPILFLQKYFYQFLGGRKV